MGVVSAAGITSKQRKISRKSSVSRGNGFVPILATGGDGEVPAGQDSGGGDAVRSRSQMKRDYRSKLSLTLHEHPKIPSGV